MIVVFYGVWDKMNKLDRVRCCEIDGDFAEMIFIDICVHPCVDVRSVGLLDGRFLYQYKIFDF